MSTRTAYRTRWTYEPQYSPVTGPAELIMLGNDRFSKAMPLYEHTHEQSYEFVFCESGKVTWEVNGELYETTAGQTFYTRPDERHRARMNHMEPCGIWWMIIRDPIHAPGWLGLDDTDRRELNSALQHLPRIVQSYLRIRDIFRGMRSAVINKSPFTALKLKLGMLDFLLQLTEPTVSSHIPEDLLLGLHRIRESMIRSPELRISNRDWALELGVSESHFYRLFKENFGQSPASFMERRCIEDACQRLHETDASVTAIAMELGFKTSQHFATVFKKNTGLTPTDWRRIQP